MNLKKFLEFLHLDFNLESSYPLIMTCYTIAAGFFLLFARWMQLQIAFDEDNLITASSWNVLFPLLIAGVAYLFYRLLKKEQLSRRVVSKKYTLAFANPGKVHRAFRVIPGVLMVLGALALYFTCETEKLMIVLRVLAGIAAVVGVTYPLLLRSANEEEPNLRLNGLYAMAPVLMFSLWLIISYKQNEINSSRWHYAMEMVTFCLSIITYLAVAGYHYYSADPKKVRFLTMFTCSMTIGTIADGRNTGMQIILIASALMLAYYVWVLSENLVQKEIKERKTKSDGFDHLTDSVVPVINRKRK